MRHALNVLAEVVPDWLIEHMQAEKSRLGLYPPPLSCITEYPAPAIRFSPPPVLSRGSTGGRVRCVVWGALAGWPTALAPIKCW